MFDAENTWNRIFLISLFLFILHSDYSFSQNNIHKWNVSEILPVDSGISVFRYGAIGLGAYPYSNSLPGAGFKVTLDGIPLRSHSLFGPDLELVSFELADSLEYHNKRTLNILTGDVNDELPVTNTRFLLGSRRRFNVDINFRRMVNEKSGIFFNGSSGGIHGTENTLKTSLRNYYLKYQRFLENGSAINFSLRAIRDRDGLFDLDSKSKMGEIKTDTIVSSIGLKNHLISKNTTVSPVIFYEVSNSRFDRNGARKSLDDNAAGLNISFLTRKGNSTYCLKTSHIAEFFDSRIQL